MNSRSFPLTIREDDLAGEAIAELLQTHIDSALNNSPQDAAQALHLDRLRQSDITLWSAWHGSDLAGCAAIRELSKTHGEIKSMRTASQFLRRGVAASLLDHLLRIASDRGYQRLSLETGNTEAFAVARALYARFGFAPCPPFGDYVDDGFSVCMTRVMQAE
jgi:putative acetyltransferase